MPTAFDVLVLDWTQAEEAAVGGSKLILAPTFAPGEPDADWLGRSTFASRSFRN